MQTLTASTLQGGVSPYTLKATFFGLSQHVACFKKYFSATSAISGSMSQYAERISLWSSVRKGPYDAVGYKWISIKDGA